MTEPKLVKSIYLKAPRERVWSYLTEPEKLARWFHEAENVLEAGKPYALLRETPDAPDPRLLWGKVLEAEMPARLVYTFTWHSEEAFESVVEWVLVDVAGGTQLTMTHSYGGVPAEHLIDEISGTDRGWDEHLSRLRNLIN